MGSETRKDTPLPSQPEPGPGAPGLEPGGSIRPGDTPPAADSIPGAVGDVPGTPNQGPVAGNRTPMIVTLAVLAVLVLAVIGYGIAEAVGYLRQ